MEYVCEGSRVRRGCAQVLWDPTSTGADLIYPESSSMLSSNGSNGLKWLFKWI